MLKTLRETMTKKLTFKFQVCINVEYHSKLFRKTKIIMLKKIKKNDYIFFKVYRLIVLLNTINKINKILELIMINKITELAKKNLLLSKSQISEKKIRNDIKIAHKRNSRDLKTKQK